MCNTWYVICTWTTIKTHQKSDGISCLQCHFPYYMCHKIKEAITASHIANSINDDNNNNANADTWKGYWWKVCDWGMWEEVPIVYGI